MAGKLKRIDGVSNKKVKRHPAEKREKKDSARLKGTSTGSSASPVERTRVEKRRARAAEKARPAAEVPAAVASRKQARAADSDAKVKKAPKKGGKAGPEAVRDARPRRTWRAISPRVVIPTLLLVVFIALSASPVARNFEATSKLKAAERELARQQETTRELNAEVAQARSMEYIEQEARHQRMVAPGEVLYLVTTDAKGPEVEYRIKALQSMDEAWERVRQMLHCTAERQPGEQ